jgi:hypothetical protein
LGLGIALAAALLLARGGEGTPAWTFASGAARGGISLGIFAAADSIRAGSIVFRHLVEARRPGEATPTPPEPPKLAAVGQSELDLADASASPQRNLDRRASVRRRFAPHQPRAPPRMDFA